ncbi:MAG: LA_2272 family surface repeat-containing protein [Ignavibacteriales bacterium]
MNKNYSLIISCIIILFSLNILAQDNPFQLSLFNPVQIVPENESVSGIRLNLIYTKNVNVSGFDLGLVNVTTGKQLGVQWGGVNLTDGGFSGWQSGFVNVSKANFTGLQTSWVNYHDGHFNGLQFSIVNYTETLEGLQLGLINIIGKGGFLPVFPIFNFDFD